MYGLINRSVQCFLEDTYGRDLWDEIVRKTGLEFRDFEAMLSYPDEMTDDILDTACDELRRDRSSLLEDLGTYLVTNPNMNTVRRLLRFGGHTFEEFLYSLDDLHDRVKLAVPDLELPKMELRQYNAQTYALIFNWKQAGFGAVMEGILLGLADDYGALVVLETDLSLSEEGVCEVLRIELMAVDFSDGRDFALGRKSDEKLIKKKAS